MVQTLKIINDAAKIHDELVVIDKANSGHGPTILQGYLESESKWIFQIDSDNEIEADQFEKLWQKREGNDFVVGVRINRESPLSRKIVSFVSKLTVHFFYGRGVQDVNCPFRLFRKISFSEAFQRIPSSTFAPNVILSGIACSKRMGIVEIPVEYNFRSTGVVSIKKWKLFKMASKSLWQTVHFAFQTKSIFIRKSI